jgi:hypothetical protein
MVFPQTQLIVDPVNPLDLPIFDEVKTDDSYYYVKDCLRLG